MVNIDEAYVRQKCMEAASLGDTRKTAGPDNTTTSIGHLDVDVVGSSCEGGSVKISITIVSNNFFGVPLIKRHRLMNEIFATELQNNSIHALSVKAYTPQQWETKQQHQQK